MRHISRNANSITFFYFGLFIAINFYFIRPAFALAGIQNQVHEIVRSAGLQETKVAIFVADLDNKNELVAINIDEPMIPASNMKLFVTAAALHVLGPDHVFRTELQIADGSPDEVRAPYLEEDEVVRVVDETHLVGLAVPHPGAGRRG